MNDGPIKFLLVDDEEDLLELVVEFLLDWYPDCTVDTAINGIHAIEKLAMNDYSLIATDYRMPNMDGEELIEWVKSPGNRNETTPILLITAFPYEAREIANKYGIYLAPKPATSEELEKTFRLLLPTKPNRKRAS